MNRLIPYFSQAVTFMIIISGLIYGSFLYIEHNDQMRDNEILALKNQIDVLQISTQENITAAIASLPKPTPTIISKSQDELLTKAVSKASPAVVSITVLRKTTTPTAFNDGTQSSTPFNNQTQSTETTGATTLEKVGAGSGFIISKNGYLVTNKHVVATVDAEYVVTLQMELITIATVVYRDPNNDIAILKIEGTNFTAVTLGNSSTLQLGQTVEAIGNALGEYSNSVSVGIISGLNRTIQATGAQNGNTEYLSDIIQTDAAINPGNSGGPLLDLNGNVIGVNVATIIGSNNISFSIPINTVKDLAKMIVKE